MIWKKHALVCFSKTQSEVFEKLIRACFFPNCTRNHAFTFFFRNSLVIHEGNPKQMSTMTVILHGIDNDHVFTVGYRGPRIR